LLRQLLTESALLALAGGAFGLLAANWSLALLNTYLPVGIRRLLRGAQGLSIDQRVLAFAVGLSLLTVILFGLAPAIRSTRFDVMSALRSSSGELRLNVNGTVNASDRRSSASLCC